MIVAGTSLRERQKLQTRADILGAAWALSVSQGLGATKMGEIAMQAGVSEKTLYNHFASKDELASALLDGSELTTMWLLIFDGVSEELSPAAALLDAVDRLDWPDRQREERVQAFLRSVQRDPQLRAAYHGRQEQAVALLAETLSARAHRHHMPEVTLRTLCSVILSVFNAVASSQPERLVAGRWERDLKRELDRVAGAFL